MLSGRSGVKYGLQINTKNLQLQKQQAAAKAKTKVPVPSIFSGDDDEDNIEAEIARQASKKRSQREIERQHAEALEQDPNAFDYDGIYEDIKGAQMKPIREDKIQRESKYIGKLLQKAAEREREQDVVFERQLAKERAKEDHLYGDKEKFVTRAYREKLAERAHFLAEEKRQEALELANDVTKKGDLSDFYRNLLTKNEAFGALTKKEDPAVHPKPYSLPLNKESAPPSFKEPGRGAELREDDLNEASNVDRLNAAPADIEPLRSSVHSSGAVSKENSSERSMAASLKSPVEARKEDGDNRAIEQYISLPQVTATSEESPVVLPAQSSKRVNSDSVLAAKERYLSRKKQRTLKPEH